MEGATVYTPPLLLLPAHEAPAKRRRRRAPKAELAFAPLPAAVVDQPPAVVASPPPAAEPIPPAPPSAVRRRRPVRPTEAELDGRATKVCREQRADDLYALMVDAWAAGYEWSMPDDDEGVGCVVLRKGRRAGVVIWPSAVARLSARGWRRKLGEIRRQLGLEVAP